MFRCGSNCKPIALPASGRNRRIARAKFSSPAIWIRASPQLPQWVMTPCKSAPRGPWFPIASRTALPRSECAGFAAVSTQERSTTATLSARANRCNPGIALPRGIASARRRGLELAFQVLGELRDGRIVEKLGEIHEPGKIPIHALVDFDQLQGTRAARQALGKQ